MNHQTNQVYKNHWQSYLKLGLIPFPALKTDKYPLPEIKWGQYQEHPPCSDEYLEWEGKYADYNIWVLLGEVVVIDPDGPGAEEFVRSLNLPPCPISISGNRSIHRWFKTSPLLKPLKIQNGDTTYLELRTGNQGMLVPPSIHPETRRPYQWKKGHSPWNIPFPEFPLDAYGKIRDLLPKPNIPMMALQTDNTLQGTLDVEEYLRQYRIEYRLKREENRTIYSLHRCLFAESHTTKDTPGDSSIIQGKDGKLGYHCFHNHCSHRTWQDARKAISGNETLTQFLRVPNPYLSVVLSADDIISADIPPKRMIISPWLYEQSIILIVGWRGLGKTWFGLSFFDAVTREEPFGPWDSVISVPALYIDGEMAFIDIQERLRLLGNKDRKQRRTPLKIYSDAHANSLGIPRASLISKEWRRDVKNLILDNGFKLVALDNIASLAPGLDENSKKDWDPINQWLLELRFSGITTALLHHENKSGGQRGTSAHEDNIDTSISLFRPYDYRIEEGSRFIVKFKKTRISTKELSLLQDYEFHLKEVNNHVEWVWNSAKKKNQIEILRMIDEGMKQDDIANDIGVTKGFVSQVKSKAIKDGYLDKSGKLTPKGQALVNRGSLLGHENDVFGC